jgi:transcriptional regulator with XRE-family HTH domain
VTPAEFRDTLHRLGLSQIGLARIMGVTRQSAWNWMRGEAPVPVIVVKLLALIEAGKITLEDLR